ncbi:para-aminobenzoate synthetase [Saccharopolyspora kobensis]|uniref:aminodeoxychorismate synthase n=1 Tax=Saccharopolyspora kobensis TaxID=146035 RepID=A0A1H5UY12_9PSEU|nr:aminodeoxychorismate synthase component I [Saccharopolyspora kobensis]SEF79906.1 para-aminobenzoate synthetase [Saccharopolyspora kobensis]SFC67641.1 para-aminobenzoate synthetase [Saccharopolyspora kobensis]
MLRTLLIDNYDSFTYNLNDLLHRVNGAAPHVVTNDTPWSDIDLSRYDSIVVSPGPGRPQRERDLGISALALKQSQIPVLGICLGHQGISHLHGGRVEHAPEPMHGRVCEVHHSGTDLFSGLPSPFKAVRYHSLAAGDLPADVEPLAWTADGVVMALRSLRAPQWGVQFHPESILSEFGADLLYNFRRLVEDRGSPSEPTAPAHRRSRYRIECREIDALPETQELFVELYGSSENAFWLDSSSADRGVGRFTIMGDDSGPLAEHLSYSVSDGTWTITSGGRSEEVAAGFFEHLNDELANRRVEHPSRLPIDFNLGYVGALGYELKAETGVRNQHVSPRPDAQLIFADRAIVVDHQARRSYLLALIDPRAPETMRGSAEWLDRTSEVVQRRSAAGAATSEAPGAEDGERPRIRFDQTRSAYLDSIATCLEAITDGESYEICLTNTGETSPLADPLRTYLRLRSTSPVPFGAYLRAGSTAVLSASPERFVEVRRDGRVQAKPIKGTRPRGETPEADAELVRDLATNVKDQAENLMIVDLLRNDLHRVCAVGSVHVPKLFDVETYSHVHQLVSTIEGQLAAGSTAVDCIRAAFPGGSMTGAPKVRTMEIIDSLERRARGYYSGAIGWLSLSGAADLNIVIRTLVNDERSCTFGVGGAIVSLSDPEEEYRETLVKSRAMVSALGAAIEDI